MGNDVNAQQFQVARRKTTDERTTAKSGKTKYISRFVSLMKKIITMINDNNTIHNTSSTTNNEEYPDEAQGEWPSSAATTVLYQPCGYECTVLFLIHSSLYY